MGGLFRDVGAFLLFFSPYRGPFSMWGGAFTMCLHNVK